MKKIIGVAIKVNGEVFAMLKPCGHSDVYKWLHNVDMDISNSCICEGFITDTNEFVDRYKAAKIAKKANQIINDDFVEYGLYSEDVW